MQNMQRKLRIGALTVAGLILLLYVGSALWNRRLSAPVASPTSPAIGTWKKGGITFILNRDGMGQEHLGARNKFPLTWTEQREIVNLKVKMDGLEFNHLGNLSPDKRTLIITQTGALVTYFVHTKEAVRWELKKQ